MLVTAVLARLARGLQPDADDHPDASALRADTAGCKARARDQYGKQRGRRRAADPIIDAQDTLRPVGAPMTGMAFACFFYIPSAVRARAADSAAARGEKKSATSRNEKGSLHERRPGGSHRNEGRDRREPESDPPRAPEVGAHLADNLSKKSCDCSAMSRASWAAASRGAPRARRRGAVSCARGYGRAQGAEKTDLPFRSENGSMHACGTPSACRDAAGRCKAAQGASKRTQGHGEARLPARRGRLHGREGDA